MADEGGGLGHPVSSVGRAFSPRGAVFERWGVTDEGIEPFLTAQGYRILADDARYDLKKRYLEPVAKGDQLVSRLERVVAVEPLP